MGSLSWVVVVRSEDGQPDDAYACWSYAEAKEISRECDLAGYSADILRFASDLDRLWLAEAREKRERARQCGG